MVNLCYSAKPNIIFLLIDDQRNDTLGCAGHPIIKTPNIDSLAKEGIRFKNSFVTTSICAASRASFLTGLTERAHGYNFGKDPVSIEHMHKSYPALLKKAGYRTGFVGKYGIKTTGSPEEDLFDFMKIIKRNPYFIELEDGTTRHETELCADEAIRFLSGHSSNQPFCLSISFNAVHAEDSDKTNHFPAPRSVQNMYQNIVIPKPRLNDQRIYENHPDFLKNSMNRQRYHWRWDTHEKYQKNMRSYFRMISGVDHSIGRIITALQENKLSENTVIIYTGDNGYYMGDRGFAGKWSHYEQSLRVPLIVFDPRAAKHLRGKELNQTTLNIDLAPTLLELAQVPIPSHYQGQSYVPLLNGNSSIDWRTDFFCEHLMEHESIPKWEGVRGNRYVYAKYFGQDPIYEFLHDLHSDPDQLVNLAKSPEFKDTLMTMRKKTELLKKQLSN